MPTKAKKSILCLSHTSDFTGGAESVLLSLIETTLDTYNWRVIVPSSKGGFVEKLRAFGSDVKVIVAFTPWWCTGSSYGMKVSSSGLSKSLQIIRKELELADVAYTSTMVNPWLAAVAAEVGVPHVWHVHEFGYKDHGLKFALGYKNSLQFIESNSIGILTISKAVRDLLTQDISISKVKIVHQSVGLEALVGTVKNNKEKIKGGKTNILILGSIKASKGQILLVKALNGLVKREKSLVRLRIAGPPVEPEYLSRLRELTVGSGYSSEIFPEFVDNIEQYNWADVVVVPSLNEALGRSTIEAVASGKIVVGSESGATPELLGDGIGFMFKPADVVSLRRTISKVIKNGDQGLMAQPKRIAKMSRLYSPSNQKKEFIEQMSKYLDSYSFGRKDAVTKLTYDLKALGLVESPLKNALRTSYRRLRSLLS